MNNALPGLIIFLILPISFVIAVLWFLKKYPPPKSEENKNSTNLFDALNDYAKNYPGFIGKFVKYGLEIFILLVLILRIYSIFKK